MQVHWVAGGSIVRAAGNIFGIALNSAGWEI